MITLAKVTPIVRLIEHTYNWRIDHLYQIFHIVQSSIPINLPLIAVLCVILHRYNVTVSHWNELNPMEVCDDNSDDIKIDMIVLMDIHCLCTFIHSFIQLVNLHTIIIYL